MLRLSIAAPLDTVTPSSYPVVALSNTLADAGLPVVRRPRRLGSVLRRVPTLTSWVPRPADEVVICPMMGRDPVKAAAYGIRRRLVPVCWDVWEPQWPAWVEFLRRLAAPVVFVTSKQSTEHLASSLDMPVIHLPEATQVDAYLPGTQLADRRIHVLEMGRRYQVWHDQVTARLAAENIAHLYERKPGAIIFPARQQMVSALSESAVSVCFPSSMTHPARSGDVETLTHRYLESFASRAVVLGHAPAELVELFGYNPVVEADMSNAPAQLLSILANIGDYQETVDRNHRRVREVADWPVRTRELLDHIRSAMPA